MKKACIIWVILLSTLVSCLVGCNNNAYHWEFNYNYTEISEIKLITIVKSDPLEYEVIKEIDLELAEEICDDISSLEMQRYGPNLSSHFGVGFLIVFNNGEYDLITQKEPSHFKFVDSKLEGYNSWLYFDENEFKYLIKKQLSDFCGTGK